jgi:hypothetical protein
MVPDIWLTRRPYISTAAAEAAAFSGLPRDM